MFLFSEHQIGDRMDKHVILFGAGSDIYKILTMLEKENKKPLCICDNNPCKWGGD